MRTQRVMGVESSGRYNRVILLLVESGALISATKITEFVLYNIAPDDGVGGLNAMYIIYEIVPQMTVRNLSPPCLGVHLLMCVSDKNRASCRQ